jgi:hypothetical protein
MRERARRDRSDHPWTDQPLVSPPPGCVMEQIREFDPSLVGPTGGRALSAEPIRAAQWVVISLLIPVSLAVEATCDPILGAIPMSSPSWSTLYSGLCECGWRVAKVMTGLSSKAPLLLLEDVNMEFLDESPTHTICSWKGEASYYTVLVYGWLNIDAARTTRIRPRRPAEFAGRVGF